MPRLALDTLALDARLGHPRGSSDVAGEWASTSTELPRVSLIDLPRECARRGIDTLELRAAQLPRVDDVYLTDFRATCAASDVELFSLAIDGVADLADLTGLAHADAATRYEAVGRVKPWIARTSVLQAPYVRFTPPTATDDASTDRVKESISELAEHARRHEVKLLLRTTSPDALLASLDQDVRKDVAVVVELDGRRDPQLRADASRATLLATWRSKMESLVANAAALLLPADLSTIVADAADAAAKPSNEQKVLDVFRQAMKDKRFNGPVILTTAGDPPDEWKRVLDLRDALRDNLVLREAWTHR
jgi:sugar phosphate isomerase/epimerase